MCGYFGIGFIDFMLKGISLLDYTNLLSPNEHEKKNDKIILKLFQWLKGLRWKTYFALFVVTVENLENLKYHTFWKKTLVISISCSKCKNEDEKIFKEE